ncbi:MAG TPA: 4a-hydroxytetrahydrobiopterin dehydratase [Ktedonobacterales bacterium]|nr:4a-hydroxytetrahydrobiopterin dehydratase [Ktedonobacterales bacterium]
MAKLTDDELQVALGRLGGWALRDGELEKVFSFSTFPDGIAFVTRVADLAEEAEHHPDIDIRYSTVTLRLSTHSEGGITQKDTDLARKIDGLLR